MKKNSLLSRALSLGGSAVLMAGLFLGVSHSPLAISAAAATAGNYYEVNATSLNVRSGPGLNYSRQGRLADGAIVKVLDTNGDWAKIDGGWVFDDYLVPTKNVVSPDKAYTAYVKAATLNIRSGPGTNYTMVGQYSQGYRLNILETKDGWGRTSDGWVLLKHTSSTEPVITPSGSSQGIKADSKAKVIASVLNVRQGPGTQYAKTGKLSADTVVTIQEVQGNWGKVADGWISLSYVRPETSGSSWETPARRIAGDVTADVLHVRTGPGTNYQIAGSLTKGYRVTILESSNGWGRTSDGWVNLKYIRQVP